MDYTHCQDMKECQTAAGLSIKRARVCVCVCVCVCVRARASLCTPRSLVDHLHDCLANGAIRNKHCYCEEMESLISPFDCHTYILPLTLLKVNFKVMHISSENISQTVADRTSITTVNTESRMWQLDWQFTFDPV